MCKTWNIVYTCKHTLAFRLSTCSGSFTHQAKKSKQPVSSCKSGPLLAFRSSGKCGPCAKTEAERQLAANIYMLREALTCTDWAAETSEEDAEKLAMAESDYETDKWRLDKRFPDGRFKKIPRPEKGRGSTRAGGSLLREEVMPEDVVLKRVVNNWAIGGGWDDENWGDNWKSLDEEIAEREAERAEAPYCPVLGAWTDAGWELGMDPGKAEDIKKVPVVDVAIQIIEQKGENAKPDPTPKPTANAKEAVPPHERPRRNASRDTPSVRYKAGQAVDDFKGLHGCGFRMELAVTS